MAVRQRGGSWQADITVKGVRHRETFDTEQAARAWVLRAEAARVAGEAIPRPNAPAGESAPLPSGSRKRDDSNTLAAFMERTHARYWANSRYGDKTRINMAQVNAYFGQIAVDRIDSDALDGFIAHCTKRGNADATINRKLAIISKTLKFAMDRGAIQKIPRIERKKVSVGRLRWLSEEEEVNLLGLLRQWGKDEHVEVVTVLLDTGMRPLELYSMALRDVHLKENMLSIWDNKTDHPRSVYMTKRVRAIIEKRCGAVTAPKDRLFPYDNFWMRTAWDRARGHLGFMNDENYVPYICRHTCASRMIQRGVALPIVMKWLGHKTVQMTMRYAHLAPQQFVDAAAVLEAGE